MRRYGTGAGVAVGPRHGVRTGFWARGIAKTERSAPAAGRRVVGPRFGQQTLRGGLVGAGEGRPDARLGSDGAEPGAEPHPPPPITMDLARVGLLHDAATGSEPVAVLREAWTAVLRYDYEPVFRPALNVLEALAAADAQGGVNQAVRAVAAWAKENAETYVSMGMEYAGELFSRVLGNQASDGEELRGGLHAGRDGNASAGQGPVPRWNSTPVLLQLLNMRTKMLMYLSWSVAQLGPVRVPASLGDSEGQASLVADYDRLCRARLQPWSHADTDPVRREIDDAVAQAYGISPRVLADWRERMAKEPTIANRSPL